MAVNFLQYPFKLSWRQQIPLHSPRKPCNTSNEKNRATVPWDFFNYEYDYRQNWTTCSPATNCSKLWQNFRTKLECVIRFHEKNSNSTSAWCALFIYKGITFLSFFTFQLQAFCVHCPISAKIGLVMTNHFLKFFEFVWNISKHKLFMISIFDLLKVFRSCIYKNIEKPQ